MHKKCKDCQQVKLLEAFHRNRNSIDGRQPYCKACANLRYKHRRTGGGPDLRKPANKAPEGQKWCPRCQRYLDKSEFTKNKSAHDGLSGYCRPCHNIKSAESRERNGGARNYHLIRRYGVTALEVDEMLEEQPLCWICMQAPADHVDHDHADGMMRGLLCFNCNGGLGQFGDDPWKLARAISYLLLSGRRVVNHVSWG